MPTSKSVKVKSSIFTETLCGSKERRWPGSVLCDGSTE